MTVQSQILGRSLSYHCLYAARNGEVRVSSCTRPDAMSVASFVAAQRTEHGVPTPVMSSHDVVESWFHEWNRPPYAASAGHGGVDAAVKAFFGAADGT